MAPLHAKGAGQLTEARGEGLVLDLEARLLLLVREEGVRLSLSVLLVVVVVMVVVVVVVVLVAVMEGQLLVLVIGGTEPEADSLDAHIADAPLAFGEHLVLLEVDAWRMLYDLLVAGDTVKAFIANVGDAKEAVRAHQRSSDRTPSTIKECVQLATAGRVVVV